MNNPYELLDEKSTKQLTKRIDTILESAAKKILKEAKKHPKAGIGDTATDEAITTEFYNILHWGN